MKTVRRINYFCSLFASTLCRQAGNDRAHGSVAMYGVIIIAVDNLFKRFICLYVIGSQRLTFERNFKSLVYCGQIESRLVCGIILERGVNLDSVSLQFTDKRHMKLPYMTAHRGDEQNFHRLFSNRFSVATDSGKSGAHYCILLTFSSTHCLRAAEFFKSSRSLIAAHFFS